MTVPSTTAAHVGLGANQGEAAQTLESALAALHRLPGTQVTAVSSLYASAPVDAAGPDFLNAAVRLDTVLTPFELLAELQRIEAAHGRERPYRNAPRTLDLDLLLYDGCELATPTLTLPHPRLHERAFVLRPLAEIEPTLSIPGLSPMRELLTAVAGQRIERLGRWGA